MILLFLLLIVSLIVILYFTITTTKPSLTNKALAESSVQPSGLSNPGSLCYLNSVIQSLRSCKYFIKELTEQGILTKTTLDLLTNNSSTKDLLFLLKNKNFKVSNNKIINTSTQEDPSEFLIKFLDLFDESLINKIFKITQKQVLKCINKPSSSSISKMLSLELPITGNTLTKCIENYFSEEQIDETCSLQFSIESLPKQLIIVLKRFYFNNGPKKNSQEVFYDTSLDLANKKYKLISVINHLGRTVGSGHCNANVFRNENWFFIDDSKVFKESFFDYNNSYILFYELIS